jgi:hypothetical protein
VDAESAPRLGRPSGEFLEGLTPQDFGDVAPITTPSRSGRRHQAARTFSKKSKTILQPSRLYVAHYNFYRIHETLRTRPAIALGIAEHVWSIGELDLCSPKSCATQANTYSPRIGVSRG